MSVSKKLMLANQTMIKVGLDDMHTRVHEYVRACDNHPMCHQLNQPADYDPYSMYFNQAKHDHQGEAVETPSHYMTGGIETIDYIKAKLSRPHEYEGFLRGNVIKYLSRYEAKAGVKDLEKALKYLGWLIEHLNGQASENRQ